MLFCVCICICHGGHIIIIKLAARQQASFTFSLGSAELNELQLLLEIDPLRFELVIPAGCLAVWIRQNLSRSIHLFQHMYISQQLDNPFIYQTGTHEWATVNQHSERPVSCPSSVNNHPARFIVSQSRFILQQSFIYIPPKHNCEQFS